MKILRAEDIRKADQFTIENEPIASIDLMERAAAKCYLWIKENLTLDHCRAHVLVGPGNNGGDGLVIARMLFQEGFPVSVYALKISDRTSEDFAINYQRYLELGGVVEDVYSADFNLTVHENDLIIDAVFGSGLNKPVSGWLAEFFQRMNQIDCLKLAIDIPSGLFADDNSGNDMNGVIKADVTLSFQNPKMVFFQPLSGSLCGSWEILDIGLNRDFIESCDGLGYTLDAEFIQSLLKGRSKFDHKGTFGHALVIAGSHGKMGATILASRSALKSGLGLLTTYIPECGYDIMQTAVPEAMVITSSGQHQIQGLPISLPEFSSMGIGPGIGGGKHVESVLSELFRKYKNPIVLDADALNAMSGKTELLASMPPKSILTPHPGEFKSLVGDWKNDEERLAMQIEFSKTYDVYLVLKGAHTCISSPEGELYFNTSGNPGMATAGSGDVLLGVITSLLSRGYDPLASAQLGVFLHGLAGDFAAVRQGEESMTAGDIIEGIPMAFQSLYDQ